MSGLFFLLPHSRATSRLLTTRNSLSWPVHVIKLFILRSASISNKNSKRWRFLPVFRVWQVQDKRNIFISSRRFTHSFWYLSGSKMWTLLGTSVSRQSGILSRLEWESSLVMVELVRGENLSLTAELCRTRGKEVECWKGRALCSSFLWRGERIYLPASLKISRKSICILKSYIFLWPKKRKRLWNPCMQMLIKFILWTYQSRQIRQNKLIGWTRRTTWSY